MSFSTSRGPLRSLYIRHKHPLQIYLRKPIVKDDLKYMDEKKGYKVINGKKISRARVSRNKRGRPKKV